MTKEDIQKLLETKEEFRVLIERPFNTIYESNTLVVKIAKPEIFPWQIKKFTREKMFFEHIKNSIHELKVPEIVLIDESKTKTPYDFMVMKKVEGITLWSFIKQNPGEIDLLQMAGKTIANIHSITLNEQEYGLLNNKNYKSWEKYLSSNLSALERTLFDKEKPEWVQRTKEIITKKLQDMNAPRSLLHNDVNLGNFIINPNSKTLHLIDGEVACVGDPMYDLGRFNLYTPQREIVEEFKRGYSEIADINEQKIDIYSIITGLEMVYLFANDPRRISAFNEKIIESIDRISK